jgi:hypothetical protein
MNTPRPEIKRKPLSDEKLCDAVIRLGVDTRYRHYHCVLPENHGGHHSAHITHDTDILWGPE